MKKNLIFPLIALASIFASCDDNTDELGYSITNPTDRMVIDYGTFNVNSETVKLDNIISRSSTGNIGKIKDSETGSYITCNFLGQVYSMESNTFPQKDSLILTNGEIIADSCKLYVYYTTYTGDSTVSMKCKFQELAKPLSESETYNVDFKPTYENGYLRKNGMTSSTVYSLVDNSIDDKTRQSNHYKNFNILLNNEYTDVNGKKYNNYGTYILNKYYEPGGSKNFKNSYSFIHNICPGFYLEHTGGIGCMANIAYTELVVFFKVIKNGNTTKNTTLVFGGTEEVLQKTYINQDQDIIDKMKDEGEHTYLKTPAGLYTQLTLPVDEIFTGHESDTLNTASIFISRENNTKETSSYTFPIPTSILLLPVDSVDNFFAKANIANNRNSYTASYNSSTNGYNFSNISNMMLIMNNAKQKYIAEHPGTTDEQYEALYPKWNKAIIIPVIASTTRVTHNMNITSTKLIGGKDNPDAIKISCIYSKFQK